MASPRPIGVYYEHQHWFLPLFAELERRGVPYTALHADEHSFDPAAAAPAANHPLVVNRMSPSAWTRGRADAIAYTLHYLAHLEAVGAPVFNGLPAFTYETSKALQLSLLGRLGLPAPRTCVAHGLARLAQAARGLAFPVLVKPNVGGSGAGIARFDTPEALAGAAEAGRVDEGLDRTLLVQEYHPPRGGCIVRVETLEGRYLYGIRIHLGEGAGFNLCPADVCRTVDGAALTSAACPAGAQQAGLSVEAFVPPRPAIEAAERIARAAGLDAGGIEYLESERDGGLYFYDINALSNFVAEPLRVLGFDPTVLLVDALLARAERRAAYRVRPRAGMARATGSRSESSA